MIGWMSGECEAYNPENSLATALYGSGSIMLRICYAFSSFDALGEVGGMIVTEKYLSKIF